MILEKKGSEETLMHCRTREVSVLVAKKKGVKRRTNALACVGLRNIHMK